MKKHREIYLTMKGYEKTLKVKLNDSIELNHSINHVNPVNNSSAPSL